MGSSSDLDPDQCSALQLQFDAWNLTQLHGCAKADPCACRPDSRYPHESPITCEGKSVTELAFRGINPPMTGTIVEELGKLSNLRSIALDTNYISGTLPAGIGQLTKLEYLDVTCNKLTGIIPAFDFEAVHDTGGCALSFRTSPTHSCSDFGPYNPNPWTAPIPPGAAEWCFAYVPASTDRYFVQRHCSDANCTADCKDARFTQDACLAQSQGRSAEVECAKDGASFTLTEYDDAHCRGDPKKSTIPTMRCSAASGGGYTEDICPGPTEAIKDFSATPASNQGLWVH
jgi:hypothetical protein